MSEAQVAESIGVNLNWYSDLENEDAEVTMTLSLAQISVLAATLDTSAPELLDDGSGPADPHVTFGELSGRLRRLLEDRGASVAELADQIGWEIKGALLDPQQFWLWNADGLQDLCAVLDVSWLAALPRAVPPAGTPLAREGRGPAA